jgi:hypothetical protein
MILKKKSLKANGMNTDLCTFIKFYFNLNANTVQPVHSIKVFSFYRVQPSDYNTRQYISDFLKNTNKEIRMRQLMIWY